MTRKIKRAKKGKSRGSRAGSSHPGEPMATGVNTVARMTLGGVMPFGFPSKLMSKVRYHDIVSLTSTLGSLQRYHFRWNSTFDPDSSGVGHQPLYRDTFASIYDQYAVVSAVATIKFINPTVDAWIVGVTTDDDGTSSSNYNVLAEQATGQHSLLPPLTGSLSSQTFNTTFDAKRTLGIDPFASETYKTAVGSNPTEESDLVVWAANANNGTNTIQFNIEIIQTVVWTELQTPTLS